MRDWLASWLAFHLPWRVLYFGVLYLSSKVAETHLDLQVGSHTLAELLREARRQLRKSIPFGFERPGLTRSE